MSSTAQRALDQLLLAPGVRQWRSRRFEAQFQRGQCLGAFRGIYQSSAEAAATAPSTAAVGYDHDEPAALYRDRMERVYPADYPMLYWLRRTLDDGALRVFDLGGHVGISYYAYQKYLDYPESLQWQVLDVPAVARAGRQLAALRDERCALSFVQHIGEAERADVFFTAGCLQYMERTLAEQLAALEHRPRWVLVNLLPLHEHREFWTLQSINGSFCPYRVQRTQKFFDDMRSAGYDTADRWENAEKSCVVAFEPEYAVRSYVGAAFQLRSP